MKLEDLMKTRNGEWQDGFAVVPDHQGYYWKVAQKVGDAVVITKDGAKHFGLANEASPEEPKVVENPVQSNKRRGKKVAEEQQEEVKLDLDDIDLE